MAGGCCPCAAAWSGEEWSRHKHLGDESLQVSSCPAHSQRLWWCWCCLESPVHLYCHMAAAAHWGLSSDWLSLSYEASDWSVEAPRGSGLHWARLASHGDGPAPEPTLDIFSFYRKEWNQPSGNSFQCIFVHV